MKVIQMVPSMAYGDAVGNDVIALHDVLKRNHFKTGIYAENIDPRLPNDLVKKISALPKLQETDVIIWHMAIGTELNYKIADYPARKIMIYHNLTPASFFEPYCDTSWHLCQEGVEQLQYLANKVDYCLADSEYNKYDLIERGGCKKKIDVLPILIPFSDYEKAPNKTVIEKYQNDGYTNILFTGRIAPNKKHEDVISAFYMYQKYYNPKSRLFLVGSYNGMESYYARLMGYVKELGLNNVYFSGHVKFDEILAYYSIADVFLCMSEHEGFCVPLVEAMKFGVPVVAHENTAIGYTLGGAGVLLKEKKPLETAGVINYIIEHDELRTQIIRKQKERLRDFEHDKIEQQFLKYLKEFIGEQE